MLYWRLMKMGCGLLLLALPVLAQESTGIIEIPMFSGRPPPRAIVSDSLDVKALEASLSQARSKVVDCGAFPPRPSIPVYSGVILTLPPARPGSGSDIEIREGYLRAAGQCYTDSGQKLERLALEIAFRYDDESVYWDSGPKPMGYLACSIPDSLRPASAPCGTSRLVPGRRLPWSLRSLPSGKVDAVGRAWDGALPNRRLYRKFDHIRTARD